MSKKPQPPKQPERDAFHFPDTKRRREMLYDILTNLQNQGFTASMNLMIAEVQVGDFVTVGIGDGKGKRVPKAEHLREHRETVHNAKLAAQRVQQEIDALPPESSGDGDAADLQVVGD